MAEWTPTPPTESPPRRAAAARARAVSRGVAAAVRASDSGGRPTPATKRTLAPITTHSTDSGAAAYDSGGSGDASPGGGAAKRVLANRQSAQRSRMRKLQFMSTLELSVDKLQAEVSSLAPRLAAARRDAADVVVAHAALQAAAATAAREATAADAASAALKARALACGAPRGALPATPPRAVRAAGAFFAPGAGYAAAAAAATLDVGAAASPGGGRGHHPPPRPPPVAVAPCTRTGSPLGPVFDGTGLDSPFAGDLDGGLTPMTPLEFGAAF